MNRTNRTEFGDDITDVSRPLELELDGRQIYYELFTFEPRYTTQTRWVPEDEVAENDYFAPTGHTDSIHGVKQVRHYILNGWNIELGVIGDDTDYLHDRAHGLKEGPELMIRGANHEWCGRFVIGEYGAGIEAGVHTVSVSGFVREFTKRD